MLSSQSLRQAAASELLRRRMGRASLAGYVNAVPIPGKPDGEDSPDAWLFRPIETSVAAHHLLLLAAIERAASKPYGRFMVFMPPGSAKSTYTSVVAPTYFMGRKPGTKIILCSYNTDLARRHGRRARQIARSPEFAALFGASISPDSSAADEWALTNGSEYLAAGLMAGITGNRAHGGLIDDPIRGRADANSETIRGRVWDAFLDDFQTRLIPGGWIGLVQCMTGDTPVRMADGSEKCLRDIRPGDIIATYEAGSVSVSSVTNWRSNGPDSVYKLKTSSGASVKANGRHPFLVRKGCAEQWIRLKELEVGDFLLRAIGGNGEESSVQAQSAEPQQSLAACATRITTNCAGLKGFALRLLGKIHRRASAQSSSIGTGSRLTTTGEYSPSRKESAQYAGGRRENQGTRSTGTTFFASIIAMIRERFAACCATTATSQLVGGKHPKCLKPLRDTFVVIPDEIVSIEYVGKEEVFDVQVDRTENFLADGLVSHNTRWHEDDLAGRLLPHGYKGESGIIRCSDGRDWEVINLQAQCERDDDPLGRKPGEYLWPEWFDESHWQPFKQNPTTWASLFQQTPAPPDGELIKPDRIGVVDAIPSGHIRWMRAWDLASVVNSGDWTAGAKLGKLPDGRYIIADVVRFQRGPDERDASIVGVASQDGHGVRIGFPQDPGQAGKTQVAYMTRQLAGYTVETSPETGDKITRAEPFAAQVNAGNVVMLRGEWNRALIGEMRMFPNGKHDDQIDACSRAFAGVALSGGSIFDLM